MPTAYTINADQLIAYRDEAGIPTNSELAHRMGVSPATVSRVLAGKIGPTTRFMIGLQRALPEQDVHQLIIPRP